MISLDGSRTTEWGPRPLGSASISFRWIVNRRQEQIWSGLFSAIFAVSVVAVLLWMLQPDTWVTILVSVGCTVLLSPGLWIVAKAMTSGDTEEIRINNDCLYFEQEFPYFLFAEHDLSMPDYFRLLRGHRKVLEFKKQEVAGTSITQVGVFFELSLLLSSGLKIPVLHAQDWDSVSQLERLIVTHLSPSLCLHDDSQVDRIEQPVDRNELPPE